MCPSKVTNALGVPSKSAFTMIELIFAIVIIGISVLSLPMMTQVISQGIEKNLVQEAIFGASAELNQVLSYQWDENAMDSNDTLAKVAWTSDCNTITKLREGHINQPLHRKCVDDSTKIPTLIVDGLNDIDDTAHATQLLFTNSTISKEGYKETYNSAVDVTYADFGAVTAADKNMKKISVTISNAAGTVTLLNAYSANIGEIDYYKRSYQ